MSRGIPGNRIPSNDELTHYLREAEAKVAASHDPKRASEALLKRTEKLMREIQALHDEPDE